MLDAITRGMFSVSATDFVGLTKNLDIHGASKYDGTNNSWEITAPELASVLFGQNAGITTANMDVMDMIKSNLKRGGGKMVANVILIPIAFKYGRKLLAKPLIRPANRLLSTAGVKL